MRPRRLVIPGGIDPRDKYGAAVWRDALVGRFFYRDAGGDVADSINYDSFGLPGIKMATRYQYTGREFDNQTGLYYYRARWYDPQLGRFISEDPIGFGGGDVNFYGYVENNPVQFTDPSGLYSFGYGLPWKNGSPSMGMRPCCLSPRYFIFSFQGKSEIQNSVLHQ